jgi:selenocysteine lyase/cysteine desulfurase
MTQTCRDALAEHTDVIGEPNQGTLVSFVAPDEPVAVAAALYERGVIVRDLPGTGWLRASCGYWTSENDIARLAEGVTAPPAIRRTGR